MIEEESEGQPGLVGEPSEIKSSELSLHLEFFDGSLFFKASDRRVTEGVSVDLVFRSPLQILYFVLTGRWDKDVQLILSDFPSGYSNLISKSHLLDSKNIDLSDTDLLRFVAFDPDSKELYWIFNPKYSGLKNALLQEQSVKLIYQGREYVNFEGDLVPFEEFEREFFLQL